MANNVRTTTNLKPPSKKTIVIFAIVAFLLLFGSSFKSIATFFVEKMLFNSLGQGDTFNKLLSAKYFIPLTSFVIMTFLCAIMIFIITRAAKNTKGFVQTDDFMKAPAAFYKAKPNLVRNTIALVVGLFYASTTYGYYKEWILFRNGSNTGVKDATFKKDIAFYLFKLPFIQASISWIFNAVVVLILLSVLIMLLTGSLRFEANKRHISTYGRIHISVLLFVATLVKATQYYFDRFSLVHSTRGAIDGATYTDVNASVPALRLMMFVAIIAAILFLVNVFRKGIVLPLVALGLWLIIGIVVGTAYPAIIQRFVVTPSRNTKEKTYAQHNIKATKMAYNIEDIEEVKIPFKQNITAQDAPIIKAAIADTQLFDDSSVVQYIQQKRGEQYYEFSQVDRDRYVVDGKVVPSLISARELLSSDRLPDKSWQSIHSVYSHGFGAAIVDSTSIQSDATPNYLVADLPSVSNSDKTDVVEPADSSVTLDSSKARIYFGEGLNEFAFVGSGKEQSPTKDDKNIVKDSTGVKLDSWLKKAVFALNYSDYNVLISDVVNKDTKIIYDRNPVERVKKIAPFLDFDSDPYPVVTDNEVVWVVDGYTTSDQYPNSQFLDGENLEPGSSLNKRINYVRNSVKATVNARTGEVNLYIVDSKDPIIKAYSKAFPKLFKKADQTPKDIVSHYRYPRDIFDVQSEILADYHVDDEATLLKSSQKWQASPDVVGSGYNSNAVSAGSTITTAVSGGRADKAKSTGDPIPSLYQYINHDSMDKPEFLLTRSFTPLSSTFQMDAYLSASSEPDNYGKMRLLQFDSEDKDSVLSPSQMVSQILADKEFSQNRTLLGQQGSNVIPGPLQMIPVADTVVYIQTQFVKGDSTDARPILTYVTVSIADKTVCAPSLNEAIDMLVAGVDECVPFAAVTEAPIPTEETPGETNTSSTTTTTKPKSTGELSGLSDSELVNKLAQARDDYEKAQDGRDLGAMQKAANEMSKYIEELDRRNS